MDDCKKIVIEQLEKCNSKEEVIITAIDLKRKLISQILPDIEKNIEIMFQEATLNRIEELKKKD